MLGAVRYLFRSNGVVSPAAASPVSVSCVLLGMFSFYLFRFEKGYHRTFEDEEADAEIGPVSYEVHVPFLKLHIA